nr:MTRF1L release factor glutamine methyltransferase isoform X3 [Zootoca vivipara]
MHFPPDVQVLECNCILKFGAFFLNKYFKFRAFYSCKARLDVQLCIWYYLHCVGINEFFFEYSGQRKVLESFSFLKKTRRGVEETYGENGRMPVQYVLGEWDFQDLTLKMKPPVFIPRPETEELVSLIVDEECRKRFTSANCKQLSPEKSGLVILEVGCGSGAIALSLLKKLPHSRVIATDKSQAAVNLAKENAARLRLQDRVKILHHDVSSSSWECLLPWGLVDTIISNPPYIFHEDMTQLAAEILRYEDLGALDGGKDGMSVIKQILKLASYVLKDGRSVFLEVDPRHPEMVENWLCSHPDLLLFVSGTHNDFCGKPRFLHIQKHGGENNRRY